MNTLRTTVLLIGLATLSACGGERGETRPEPPPAIAAILEAVNGTDAVTWQQFQELAQWHRRMADWPPSDSKLLLSIRERDKKLADALLLYRDYELEASMESAFIQYLTSTPKSVPPDAPHADAEKWAQDYSEKLSVPWPPKRGFLGIPYSPPEDMQSLKSRLVLINRARYGWDEVIPASVFEFRDDEKFGKKNAMWMAEMAALAYHDKHVVKEQLELWDYEVESSFRWIDHEDSGTQGFAVWNETRMILSFRGTKGFRDMVTDLMITRVDVPWTAGGIHRGFRQGIDAVWKDVELAVGEELGSRKLFITGHSLGAALAQLAAIRLKDSGETVTAVYAFGSPFIGDDDFVEAYDSLLAQRTFPHINHKDVVTRIPPRRLGFAPVATASTWLFVGSGHEMSRLEEADGLVVEPVIEIEDPDRENEIPSWFAEAEQQLQVANEFIALSPDQLTPGAYDQPFDEGRVDNHGISQYLFKLGCAILEERWNAETDKAKDEST